MKAEQVHAHRQHPKERDGGHVLAEVIRGPQPQRGGARRQRDPQQRTALRAGRFRLARAAASRAVGDGPQHQQRRQCQVAARPPPQLLSHRERRFDRHRVRQQRRQAGGIREREKPVGELRRARPRPPPLHQRAGRREHEKRQPHRGRQQEHDLQRGIAPANRRPRPQRQRRQAGRHQRDMHRGARGRAQVARDPIRKQVPRQQRHLEEEHAGHPHPRRPAEPRQNRLGHDGLHHEQQRGTRSDGQGVRQWTGVHGDPVSTTIKPQPRPALPRRPRAPSPRQFPAQKTLAFLRELYYRIDTVIWFN